MAVSYKGLIYAWGRKDDIENICRGRLKSSIELCPIDKSFAVSNGTIQELKAKRPKSGIIIKPGVSKNIGETQALIREINYKRIGAIYNPTLSVKKNWQVINTQFPIHISTLYKYCNTMGIKFKLNDDDIMEIIDFNKSANFNYKNIKNKGIKISKKRLLRIYNKKR